MGGVFGFETDLNVEGDKVFGNRRIDEYIHNFDLEVQKHSNPGRIFSDEYYVDCNKNISSGIFIDRGRDEKVKKDHMTLSELEKDDRVCYFFDDTVSCRERDSELNQFLTKLELNFKEQVKSMEEDREDLVEQKKEHVLFLMSQVIDFYGGLNIDQDAATEQIRKKKYSSSSNIVYLGSVKGFGLCRHRSILFKLVCDVFGYRCRILRGWLMYRGKSYAHMWNEVMLDTMRGEFETKLVDTMNFANFVPEEHCENFVNLGHPEKEIGYQRPYIDAIARKLETGEIPLCRSLGKGTMGEVFELKKAEVISVFTNQNKYDVSIESVAVKIVNVFEFPGPKIQASVERSVKKEVQSLMIMRHPNIAKIYGSFESLGGQHQKEDVVARVQERKVVKIVMKKYDMNGDTFLKHLNEMEGMTPEQKLTEVLIFLLEVAKGLMYVHSFRLVHLDIKPGNILVNWDNEKKQLIDVVITDFGSVKDESMDLRHTRCPEVTMQYASPEIRRIIKKKEEEETGEDEHEGESAENHFTKMSDIYSLGKVMERFCSFYEKNEILAELQEHMCDEEADARPNLDKIVRTLKSFLPYGKIQMILNAANCCYAGCGVTDSEGRNRLLEQGNRRVHTIQKFKISNDKQVVIGEDYQRNLYVSFVGKCFVEENVFFTVSEILMKYMSPIPRGSLFGGDEYFYIGSCLEFIRYHLNNSYVNNENRHIIICGHSMGGVVAYVLALLSLAKFPRGSNILCFTFGSPFPEYGWSKFSHFFGNSKEYISDNFWHFYMKDDVVPGLYSRVSKENFGGFLSFMETSVAGNYDSEAVSSWVHRDEECLCSGVPFDQYFPGKIVKGCGAIGQFVIFGEGKQGIRFVDEIKFLKSFSNRTSVNGADLNSSKMMEIFGCHCMRKYVENLCSEKGFFESFVCDQIRTEKKFDKEVLDEIGRAEPSDDFNVVLGGLKIKIESSGNEHISKNVVLTMKGGENLQFVKELRFEKEVSGFELKLCERPLWDFEMCRFVYQFTQDDWQFMRKFEEACEEKGSLECSVVQLFGEERDSDTRRVKGRFMKGYYRDYNDLDMLTTTTGSVIRRFSTMEDSNEGTGIQEKRYLHEPSELIDNAHLLSLLSIFHIYSLLYRSEKKLEGVAENIHKYLAQFGNVSLQTLDEKVRKEMVNACALYVKNFKEFEKIACEDENHNLFKAGQDDPVDPSDPSSDDCSVEKEEEEKLLWDKIIEVSSVHGLRRLFEKSNFEDFDKLYRMTVPFVSSVLYHVQQKKEEFRREINKRNAPWYGMTSGSLGVLAGSALLVATPFAAPIPSLAFFTGGMGTALAGGGLLSAFWGGGVDTRRMMDVKKLKSMLYSQDYYHSLQILCMKAGLKEFLSDSVVIMKERDRYYLERHLIQIILKRMTPEVTMTSEYLRINWEKFFKNKEDQDLSIWGAEFIANVVYPCYLIRTVLRENIPIFVSVAGVKDSGKSTIISKLWSFPTDPSANKTTPTRTEYKFSARRKKYQDDLIEHVFVMDTPGSFDSTQSERYRSFSYSVFDSLVTEYTYSINIYCLNFHQLRQTETMKYLTSLKEVKYKGFRKESRICFNFVDQKFDQFDDVDNFKVVNKESFDEVEEYFRDDDNTEEVEGEEEEEEDEGEEGDETIMKFTAEEKEKFIFKYCMMEVYKAYEAVIEWADKNEVPFLQKMAILCVFRTDKYEKIFKYDEHRSKFEVFGVKEKYKIWNANDVKKWVIDCMKRFKKIGYDQIQTISNYNYLEHGGRQKPKKKKKPRIKKKKKKKKKN